ncbi:MAG TPA: lipocalin family protein [Chryseosolibacter sp.]|nr:lipocalin family protein [Chryseosolibacter sp.]
MKSFNKRSLLIGSLVAILFISCKEDEPAPSKTPLLVATSWEVVSYEIGGGDGTLEVDECETDNIYTFSSDGSFLVQTGELKCDETETDAGGSWNFEANESILSMRFPGEEASDWEILELSENSLRISIYVQIFEAEIVVTMAPI